MFAHLKGTIEGIETDTCTVDVQGVGYSVFISKRTRQHIEEGQVCKFHIETIVREDCFLLFGFLSKTELAWFRLLMTVQSVGAKLALGILGSLSLHQLTHAIVTQNKAELIQADGVGPKLAGRILLELKDKSLPQEDGGIAAHTTAPSTTMHTSSVMPASDCSIMYHDALSALENLGYSKTEAKKALDYTFQNLQEPSDLLNQGSILRAALQFMSPLGK